MLKAAPLAALKRTDMSGNILVHIPSERTIRPVIDVAVSLAIARRSHLDAVAIGYESMSAADMVVDGYGAAVAAVMDVEHEQALVRADAAISVFEIEAKLANVSYGTRAFAAIPAEAETTVGEIVRLNDLTVVLQPEASHFSYDNIIPQAILFNSGGPMLMVPYIHKGPLDARQVGIAWDGSRLAARALRDALPFLVVAETVTVIVVNENRQNTGGASSDHLASHLAHHGIKSRTERLTADRDNVQGAILSVAADNNIGLLVMGGYGHSQLQERIFGGVTRAMFDSATVPVLMSH
jgi:nucleotide-binding universal stress UspA family protein